MSNFFLHILIVLFPLVMANSLHMVIVKRGYFNQLAIPIWPKGFGANKTIRGFLFLPVVNALVLSLLDIVFSLSVHEPILLGLALGIAYLLSELPNSYLKRRFGIAPGGQHDKHKLLFATFDKIDSAFGVALTYYLLGYADLKNASLLFVFNILVHISVAKILVKLKIKKGF